MRNEQRIEGNKNQMYSIGAVSAITGVNSITLRAWENRYGLIRPSRTESGHRIYSDEDVDVILKAVGLIERGVTISQAAKYLINPENSALPVEQEEGKWERYRDKLLHSVAEFDSVQLEVIYQDVMSVYPVQTVTRKLIIPALEMLGERWDLSDTGIAEEHFFTVFLRNKLGARFHHRTGNASGKTIIACCFPHEVHESGLLLFALAADERNYRQVLLGANMPLNQLPPAVGRTNADAIVLSGKMRLDRNTLSKELVALVQKAQVPVFVGGDVCLHQSKALKAAGCIVLGRNIDEGLAILDETLKREAIEC